MKKILSTEERIFKMQMLIYRADVNLYFYSLVYDYFSKRNEKIPQLWLLNINNAFNETISIAHTLLASTIENELRLEPIVNEIVIPKVLGKFSASFIGDYIDEVSKYYPLGRNMYVPIIDRKKYELGYNANIGGMIQDLHKEITHLYGESTLSEIKADFEKNGFHIIRHNFIGHKNENISNPIDHLYVPYNQESYISLARIIKNLRIATYFWFGWELWNPNCQSIDNELSKILK